ncbi:MAG: hypothetical protein GXX84_20875, partial [Acidobacteria bacterium]|nr:hypothetical protein [Acidobacteriota bacterium]
NIPAYDELDDHHIVPKDWGKQNNLTAEVDSILNRTPLIASTNRHVINDRLPNEYLPKLIASNGEEEVRVILESHFISSTAVDILLRDPFTPEDFEEFITFRQQSIQEAIQELLIKQRLQLPPKIREFDQQLEKIELDLRELITRALNHEFSKVPTHIQQKLKDRLLTANRKNPALDQEYYNTLKGVLEFADLRDLEDILMSVPIWSEVQHIFGSKGNLPVRFMQLAELRNAIRHIRSISDVTLKDGEAAILWFTQVLRIT